MKNPYDIEIRGVVRSNDGLQLKKLEIEMKCLVQQGMKLPNQPNQPCKDEPAPTDDLQ